MKIDVNIVYLVLSILSIALNIVCISLMWMSNSNIHLYLTKVYMTTGILMNLKEYQDYVCAIGTYDDCSLARKQFRISLVAFIILIISLFFHLINIVLLQLKFIVLQHTFFFLILTLDAFAISFYAVEIDKDGISFTYGFYLGVSLLCLDFVFYAIYIVKRCISFNK